MAFEEPQRLNQTIGDGFPTVADQVREPFLSDFLPDMFYGVPFRAVGWQKEQPHVVGDAPVRCSLPASSIEHHPDALLLLTLGHFRPEPRHRFGRNVRQNQGVPHPLVGTDCAKHIGVLPHHLPGDFGTPSWGSPTMAGIMGPPPAGLVLQQQPDASPLLPDEWGDDPGKFF